MSNPEYWRILTAGLICAGTGIILFSRTNKVSVSTIAALIIMLGAVALASATAGLIV